MSTNKDRSEQLSLKDQCHLRRVPGMIDHSNLRPLVQLKQKLVTFCLMNSKSVRNKTESITDYIIEKDIDMCAFTETWLNDQDHVKIGELIPPGYSFIHVPRPERQGGGVGLLYKSNLDIRSVHSDKLDSFEHQELLLVSGTVSFRVLIIYRPPNSSDHYVPSSVFFDEFAELVGHCTVETGNLLICGDFNFHIDDKNDRDASSMLELCDSLNLQQHVSGPTHIHGHTLDLILTRSSERTLADTPVTDYLVSDHYAILCSLHTAKPSAQMKEITYRKIKSIDIEKFCTDIERSDLVMNPSCDPDLCYVQYCTVLQDILDKHAPERKTKIIIRPLVPWYNDDITLEKQKRRQLERLWRTTDKTPSGRKAFEHQRNITQQCMQKAKTENLNNQISDSTGDQKALFRIANTLTNQVCDNPLPSCDSLADLAEGFNNFFIQKIVNIRGKLDAIVSGVASLQQSKPAHLPPKLAEFTPATEKEVLDIISKSPAKSCPLDPIPTSLLKKSKHVLAPIITSIINTSLSTSTVLSEMKIGMITPLLKKKGLETVFKNYRPVSNLPYISKLEGKVVANRLLEHVSKHNLDDPLQSAYKKGHSTESALLRVKNDLLMGMDNQQVGLLILLDLSAAFDTIDHDIMLDRLESYIGVSGKPLAWFQSYLTDRTQFVSIQGTYSSKCNISFGVPQGSVLGPILFTIYTIPLGEIMRKHGIEYHVYADDNQLYLLFKPIGAANAIERLQSCVRDIRSWMIKNKLKFNDDKTEAMFIGTQQQLKKIDIESITVGDIEVPVSTSARNLGVIYDSNLTMQPHINTICKSAWFHLRNLFQIRKYLTKSAAETLVHAFVTSRLDNGNSLLFGLPKSTLNQLQLVQNAAARLLSGKKKHDHITPVLKSLHWLPVEYRTQYKILMFTFKAIHEMAPSYISDLVHQKVSARRLRSDGKCLLQEIRTKNVTCGDRAFQSAAPRLWNSLPLDIRVINSFDAFKKKLKTELFRRAYSC